MQPPELALARLARDERPRPIARMVDPVDVRVCDVVHRGSGDIARRERHGRKEQIGGERGQPVRPGGAEEHERPDHGSHPEAQQPQRERRQRAHFGVITFSGQIVVSTST